MATTNGTTNWDGAETRADLWLSGNSLYGTAPLGGSNGYGTVFSLNTDGTGFTVLHTFSGGADGSVPNKDLVLAGDRLYGITGRGTNLAGYGSIFELDTNGSNFSLVYTFDPSSNGSLGQPNGGLTYDHGTLYGTAFSGGISNAGTIFSLATNGNLNWAYSFNPGTDGQNPLGSLVLTNGTLYGTARNGGTNGLFGTVFSISTNGDNYLVLHTFAGGTNQDGHNPNAGLLLSGNTLYGTTGFGGTNNHGTVFSINTDGSGYTVIHSFAGVGEIAEAGLIQWGDTLYGTTLGNGSSAGGTLFSVSTNGGSFTLLHAFSLADSNDGYTNSDGDAPYGQLLMSGNLLYGTTSLGGAGGNGVVFRQAIIPSVSGFSLAGSNLVLSGVNALAGDTYTLLASTNLALPLNQWSPLATNMLSGGGNFTLTATNAVDGTLGGRFYLLQAR